MKTPHRFRPLPLALQMAAAVLLLAAPLFSTRAEDLASVVPAANLGWSVPELATAKGGKIYHGPWTSQPVALTATHLPKHQWVKASLDLYIIGSWDGSSPVWGPDLWSLSVRGGQRLISATFCAWGYAGNDEQSFPDDYPHAIHPAWTGAARRDVVDILDSDPPKNGVYKIEVLFPNTDDQLVLDFVGSYQDPPKEQQVWGIGNVEISTLPDETLTAAGALPGLWEALASEDSLRADAALWRMIGAGPKASRFIKEKVDQMPEGNLLSEADGLRLHRAHRIVRIIAAPGALDLDFRMDQLSIEYSKKYRGQ